MYTLVILALVSTLQHPKFHHISLSLTYATELQCEKAEKSVDRGYIEKAFEATHKGSHVGNVTTSCTRNDINPT